MTRGTATRDTRRARPRGFVRALLLCEFGACLLLGVLFLHQPHELGERPGALGERPAASAPAGGEAGGERSPRAGRGNHRRAMPSGASASGSGQRGGSREAEAADLGAPGADSLGGSGSSGEEISGWQAEASSSLPSPRGALRGRERVELAAILRSSTDPWLRADAIDELASRRTSDVVPEIAPALDDPDREVRRIASDSLAELGDPAALAALHLALHHERDPTVRAEMAEAIDELRER